MYLSSTKLLNLLLHDRTVFKVWCLEPRCLRFIHLPCDLRQATLTSPGLGFPTAIEGNHAFHRAAGSLNEITYVKCLVKSWHIGATQWVWAWIALTFCSLERELSKYLHKAQYVTQIMVSKISNKQLDIFNLGHFKNMRMSNMLML